ncbi:MAG: lyase family protein [Pseudomonadota bacterium]
MPASPLDSAIYGELLSDREIAALFTDSAEVRAMQIVEGTLAKVQGALGMIPKDSADAIHRASLEVQIDPAALATATVANAVPVPALIAAFRKEMGAPEHAQYVHWAATSQDIMDTALALRLRQALDLIEARLVGVLHGLGTLAQTHAELPMAARTYGQHATVTSFGAQVAEWGRPLLGMHAGLAEVCLACTRVSLSGAGGTSSAMGPQAARVRTELAQALNLGDPGASWHSARGGVAGLAAWLTGVTGVLGKMGDDLHLMAQSGIEEILVGDTGGSSTMPHKSNPVQPAVLVAIARQMVGLNTVMQGAMVHRQQRDASAWMTEWMSLPQMCVLAGRALAVARTLAEGLAPNADRMRAQIDGSDGLIFAEAATFALAQSMPRPEAQEIVKALSGEVRETGRSLTDLLARDHDLNWATLLTPEAQLGEAPAFARAFAAQAAGVS